MAKAILPNEQKPYSVKLVRVEIASSSFKSRGVSEKIFYSRRRPADRGVEPARS
jgi:hypothetical protein